MIRLSRQPAVFNPAGLCSTALFCLVVFSTLMVGCAHRQGLTSEEYFLRGFYFEQNNKPWEAIVEYRKALGRDPKNNDIRIRLADLQADTRDYRGAQTNYHIILKADPDNAAAINNLSWLYAITGKKLSWAQEAMELLALRPSPHKHVYLDTLGMVYFKQEKYQAALEAFQEAADLCRQGVVMSSGDECATIQQHLLMVTTREK